MARGIDRHELQKLVGDGTSVIEVLPAKEYRLEHIAGAISVPLTKLDEARVAAFQKNAPIVVYCDDYQ